MLIVLRAQVGPGRDNSPPALSPIFTPEVQHWQKPIITWATQYQLDPNLVATIMQIESCGDPTAVSSAGAQGLFQVMPFHFAEGEDMLNPDTNAQRGLTYFVERLQQTGGDTGRAFAGYNGGHLAAAGSWADWAPETQRYYRWSTGIYGEATAGLSHSPTLQTWLEAGGISLCQQAAARLGLSTEQSDLGPLQQTATLPTLSIRLKAISLPPIFDRKHPAFTIHTAALQLQAHLHSM